MYAIRSYYVSPGLVYNLDGIEGLKESLGKNGVCSNYTDPKYTWECIKNFKGGNAVFTQPTTPIKCGGAPQKIARITSYNVCYTKLLRFSGNHRFVNRSIAFS